MAPSQILTSVVPASIVPDRIGVVSLLMPPVATLPVIVPASSAKPVITGAVGAVVSTVTTYGGAEAPLWLPATSVALAVNE